MTVNKKSFDFREAAHADGLSPEQSAMIGRLANVYRDNLPKNRRRMRYYMDRTRPTNLGNELPARFRSMKVSVGWAAKSVDMLAARSIINGFSAEGDSQALLDALCEESDMKSSYDMALPSELSHGCGFFAAVPDDDAHLGKGFYGAAVRYHDAESSAAIYDYAHRCVKAGIVIADVDEIGGILQPVALTYHDDKNVIELALSSDGWTVKSNTEHNVGRCLMEAASYRPSTHRPFGTSRISPTVMAITDDMQRAIINLALHDELHASPMKYALNLTQKQYEAITSDKAKWAHTNLLATTPGNNGANTQVGMLQATSPEGHIKYAEYLAARMASESSLPVAAFGVSGNGYTSSDALRASSDDLIIEAEALNRANGRALEKVLRMAMAIARGVPYSAAPDTDKTVSVSFADPSMPTISSGADAWLKICSTPGNDWVSGTSVYWEGMGLSSDKVERLETERRMSQARQQIMFLEDGSDENAVA